METSIVTGEKYGFSFNEDSLELTDRERFLLISANFLFSLSVSLSFSLFVCFLHYPSFSVNFYFLTAFVSLPLRLSLAVFPSSCPTLFLSRFLSHPLGVSETSIKHDCGDGNSAIPILLSQIKTFLIIESIYIGVAIMEQTLGTELVNSWYYAVRNTNNEKTKKPNKIIIYLPSKW